MASALDRLTYAARQTARVAWYAGHYAAGRRLLKPMPKPDFAVGPTPTRAELTAATTLPVPFTLTARGVDPWRITIAHTVGRADTLDAVARTGAAFLRTSGDRLAEAVALCRLPGLETVAQIEADDLAGAGHGDAGQLGQGIGGGLTSDDVAQRKG